MYNSSSLNGRYRVNTKVTVSCRYGYYITGSKVRNCQSNGHWNGEAAACNLSNKFKQDILLLFSIYFFSNHEKWICKFVLETCAPLNSPLNGQFIYNASQVSGKYPLDTEATVSCNYGYARTGQGIRTCQSDGNWTGYSATCHFSNGFQQLNNQIFYSFLSIIFKIMNNVSVNLF